MRQLYPLLLALFMGCIPSDDISLQDPVEDGMSDFKEADVRILFVGNSLTYYNDLPKLVQAEAQKQEVAVYTEQVTKSNYAIVDHWSDGTVQEKIQSGRFDYVIIQQGPSSQSEGRRILIESGKSYKALCDKHNAQLAYYMVWPSLQYFHTFEGVIKNYTDAAVINEAIVCPVGQVWKTYIDATSDYSYYGPDNFHPSLIGSQVAAKVIWESLQ